MPSYKLLFLGYVLRNSSRFTNLSLLALDQILAVWDFWICTQVMYFSFFFLFDRGEQHIWAPFILITVKKFSVTVWSGNFSKGYYWTCNRVFECVGPLRRCWACFAEAVSAGCGVTRVAASVLCPGRWASGTAKRPTTPDVLRKTHVSSSQVIPISRVAQTHCFLSLSLNQPCFFNIDLRAVTVKNGRLAHGLLWTKVKLRVDLNILRHSLVVILTEYWSIRKKIQLCAIVAMSRAPQMCCFFHVVFNVHLQQSPILIHHNRVCTDSGSDIKDRRIIAWSLFFFWNNALTQTKSFYVFWPGYFD